MMASLATLRLVAWLLTLQALVYAAPVEFLVDLPNLSDEVLEPKFQVSVAKHVLPANESAAVEGLQRVPMKDAVGRELECFLPAASPEPEPAQEEVKEPPKPSALLEPLQGTCLYRAEEWWTYEVCHRKQVRQFHKQGETVTAEFLLGTFGGNESEADAILREGGHPSFATAYVRETYGGGTPCDIASRVRTAAVRYVCGEEPRTLLASVEELHSCTYQLTVQTPLLCGHPGFKGTEVPVREIRCYPTVEPEPAEEQPEEAAAAEAEAAEPGAAVGRAEGKGWLRGLAAGWGRDAKGGGEGAVEVTIEGRIPMVALEGADLEELVDSIIRLASGEDADADFMGGGEAESPESGGSESGGRKPDRTEL